MPIRHTQAGWYWGSKGPFDTKAQALAVARAAYSHGYKEDTQDEGEAMNQSAVATFVATLLHSATVTHFMHFQVTGIGSDAAHRTLADWYDFVPDAVDSLTESIQGCYGIIPRYPANLHVPEIEPLQYMVELKDFVKAMREELPQDSEIQNEIDGIANKLNQTIYRLTHLK